MASPEPDLIFRKDLYFYDMVSAASAAMTAFPFVFRPDSIISFKPRDYIMLTGIVAGDRHFLPHDLCREANAEFLSTDTFLGTICMMLANTAYESVKDRNDRSPEFEFFRHVRNASSHLNHFTFRGDEPRRPAAWRGVVIDERLKGASNPLHRVGCFGKVLGVADIFPLLWDIEQILIKQDVSERT